MALSSNSIIPITKHRDDPRNVAVPPLWVGRRRVEPRASKSATDATAGIWRPHRYRPWPTSSVAGVRPTPRPDHARCVHAQLVAAHTGSVARLLPASRRRPPTSAPKLAYRLTPSPIWTGG